MCSDAAVWEDKDHVFPALEEAKAGERIAKEQ